MFKKLLAALLIIIFVFGACNVVEQAHKPTPKWYEQAVWYSIFPDRFRNGDPYNDPTVQRVVGNASIKNWKVSKWTSNWYAADDWMRLSERSFRDETAFRRYGGDLQGVLDKLDYLQELGITAIWFNPIFDAQSLHRYDASSYHHVDRFLGPNPRADSVLFGLEDPSNPQTWKWSSADSLFLKLIQEAHQRGIKVILDGVFNHTGTDFWAFRDIRKNGMKSRFTSWYHIQQFDNLSTLEDEMEFDGWWGIRALPELAENENGLVDPVKDHIIAVTKRWMDPNSDGDPSDGIDGWRLDVAEEVHVEFWQAWNDYVHNMNPNAYTTAESWSNEAYDFMIKAGFDGVMNYPFAFEANTFLVNKVGDGRDYITHIDSLWSLLPTTHKYSLQNLFDSHDTARLLSMLQSPVKDYDRNGQPEEGFSPLKPQKADEKRLKMMFVHLFTMPSNPLIYYGTESGMWGADDPHNRKPMVWEDLAYEPESYEIANFKALNEAVEYNQDLADFFKEMIELRKQNELLSVGEFFPFYTEKISTELISYKRKEEKKEVWVLLNPSAKPSIVGVKKPWQLLYQLAVSDFKSDNQMVQLNPNSAIILQRPLD